MKSTVHERLKYKYLKHNVKMNEQFTYLSRIVLLKSFQIRVRNDLRFFSPFSNFAPNSFVLILIRNVAKEKKRIESTKSKKDEKAEKAKCEKAKSWRLVGCVIPWPWGRSVRRV